MIHNPPPPQLYVSPNVYMLWRYTGYDSTKWQPLQLSAQELKAMCMLGFRLRCFYRSKEDATGAVRHSIPMRKYYVHQKNKIHATA